MAEDTYTTRLNLIKPDPQSAIDVTKLNTDFDRIDAGYGGIPVFATKALRNAAYATAPFALCKVGPDMDSGVLCGRQNGEWVQLTPGAPVSSGLSWTPVLTNWAVVGYTLKRLGGGLASFELRTQYSGPQITSGANGNITDITDVCTIPTSWKNSSDPVQSSWYPIFCGQAGVSTMGGRLTNVGKFDLWGLGIPNYAFPNSDGSSNVITWQGIYVLDNPDAP